VPAELDLIEEADKITHNISIDEMLNTEENCNLFAYDDEFELNETLWEEIKAEILGEYKDAGFVAKEVDDKSEQGEDVEDMPNADKAPSQQAYNDKAIVSKDGKPNV